MPMFEVICNAGTHCGTCRDPEKQAWRDSAAKHYGMPGCWPACPRGKPMKGEGEPIERIYARRPRVVVKPPPGVNRSEWEQMVKDGMV